ncbi:MAG: hypothetical protein E7464_04400 [Ruminococcaceae bacterium]|nr:hypothetical protein [Oscillospiraceae bacterium]
MRKEQNRILQRKLLLIACVVVIILLFCSCVNRETKTTNFSNSNVEENNNTYTNVIDNLVMNDKSDNHSQNCKTEEQIIEDFKMKETLPPGEVLDNVEIVKRQTREEEMTDKVYLCATSHTDVYSVVASYILTYNLYNEGWILDSVEPDWEGENYSFAHTGPDESLVDSLFEEYNAHEYRGINSPPYSSWEIVEEIFDQETQEACIVVQASREMPLWKTNERIEIYCTFFDVAWSAYHDLEDSVVSVEFDRSALVNSYNGSGYLGSGEFFLEISNVDDENNTITLYCRHERGSYDDIVWSGTFDMVVRSDNPAYKGTSVFTVELDDLGWNLSVGPASIFIGRGSHSECCLFSAT